MMLSGSYLRKVSEEWYGLATFFDVDEDERRLHHNIEVGTHPRKRKHER